MKKSKSRLPRIFFFLCLLVLLGAVVYATSPFWMAGMGRYLVEADAPTQAGIAVLLAGDSYGERILTAAQLVEAKLVPAVLVSGPPGPYGTWESELAVDWVVRQGKPREWFIPLRIEADSTIEESGILVKWLREHNKKKITIVTSNFHTRRAGIIWRKAASDMEISIVAAPCRDFDPDHWWQSRRGQKMFLFEWEKTIARMLRI